jgi:hypothetical protein
VVQHGIAAMHAKFQAFKFTTWQGPPVGLKHAKLGSVCGCFALQKQNLKKQKKIPLGNVCAAMVSNFHWCSSKHAWVLRGEHAPCPGGAVQGLWVAVFGQFHQLASIASPAMHGASAPFFSMAMLCFALASWAFVPPHLKLYFI